MRAAVLHGPCDMRVETVPEPVPGDDQLLLRVLANGICGSDLTIWRRGKPDPVILGHEIAAEIVSGPDAGRWAAVNQGNRCGTCARCRSGLDHFCQDAPGLGAVRFGGSFGGLGEYVVAPLERVILAPEGLEPGLIALSEPLGNALRTLAHPESESAESAVVIGCGPIGLALVAALHARGVPDIVAVEGRTQRAAMAQRLGAALVLDPASDVEAELAERLPLGADVVVEAAGTHAAIDLAASVARPGGSLFLQGIPMEPHALKLWSWTGKELTIRTSVGLSIDQHAEALSVIAGSADEVPWVDLITSRVALDAVPDVLQRLADGADEIKVLIEHQR